MSDHGTTSRYSKGCRCADCTEASVAYQMKRKAIKIANGFENCTHGLASTHTLGCRCDDCRDGWREYQDKNVKTRAYRKATHRAAAHLRAEHPAEWRMLLHEAQMEVGAR
jgi:hypothetical protein